MRPVAVGEDQDVHWLLGAPCRRQGAVEVSCRLPPGPGTRRPESALQPSLEPPAGAAGGHPVARTDDSDQLINQRMVELGLRLDQRDQQLGSAGAEARGPDPKDVEVRYPGREHAS